MEYTGIVMVKIPNSFLPERKYIISIFFDELLGLDYEIEFKECDEKDYRIILENKKELIIKDSFFSKLRDDKYLSKENLPLHPLQRANNQFIMDDDLPIIYGNENIKIAKDTITCGIDVFAGSFFMLSRWEEYVNKTRDEHNRFPAVASLAYKNNFLDRPIVNEYVEMLWNMLKFLGMNQKRQKRKFELLLTHDVDRLYQWHSWRQVFRVMAGDILKRKDFNLAVSRKNDYIKVNREETKDPFDTFDWLMSQSESIGTKSHFYFMSDNTTNDSRYKIDETKAIELMKDIKKRGHIIGFHPGYSTYNNFKQWKREKDLLEKTFNMQMKEGRQHYMRFEIPNTWQIWDDGNMEVDSTCNYTDKEGFRCGTGNEFSAFNILTRKKLNLKERPLLYMDTNSLYGKKISDQTVIETNIKKLLDKSKKYSMKATILFHNSIFEKDTPNYKEIYERIIQTKY